MKAVQIEKFGGPEVLQTVTIAEPNPNKDEVKVKLYATGLNPNESYTITGTYGAFIPELPYVPGFDGAGVVEEIGTNVTQFKVGDRVFVSGFGAKKNTGTYAEKVVVDADSVYDLPDKLSFLDGAGLGIPVFTAYQALVQKAQIKAGELVLIHGASGAVGSFAVQIAKAFGAIVIGTSSTEEGRKSIIDLGADFAMDHISLDNKEELLMITEQNAPEVIIEMLANKNLEVDSQVIANNGRIIVVGNRGTIEINPRNLMSTGATITGMTLSNRNPEMKKELTYGLTALLEVGAVKPLIGEKFTLDEPVAAHKALMKSSGSGRKIFVIREENNK